MVVPFPTIKVAKKLFINYQNCLTKIKSIMRKFLSLCVAMMLMVGSMSATTIYCKVDKSWWKADGAAVAVHHWGGAEAATAWPGVRMTPVTGETDVWSYDVPADVDGLMFVRVNGEGAVADWGAKTANLTLPTDGKNLYTITSESPVWGDPGVAGVWSVYGEEPIPVIPAKYYITGDSALVVNMGLGADKAWAPNAMKVEADEYVMNLAAGAYKLKVTVDGTWATGKGYEELTEKVAGQSTDGDNNIIFTLAEAGNVTVVYNDSVFTVSGNFYVEPIVPVIVKDLKLVPGVWAEAEAVLAAWTWGENADGAWSVFAGEGDTLIAKINENADSVVFVRFAAGAAIDWSSTIWNRTQDAIDECGIFFVNDWDNYSWCAAPAPVVPAKYYITGDSALVVNMGLSADKAWAPNAMKVEADEYVMNLAAGDYKLKVTVDGTWATGKGYSDLTAPAEGLSADADNNINFTLAEAGEVTVVYNDSVFTLAGNFYVKPAPVLENGFYLVGLQLNNWTPAAEYHLLPNPENEQEFMVAATLAEGDSLKVVNVVDDAITAWYPNGMNNNYVVDANHAGGTTLYFRPDYQGGEGWYEGCIYVVPTGTVDIQNVDAAVKAVKVVRNGQIMIIRDEHIYTVMGQLIK